MKYSQLFLLLEGDDDERFFKHILIEKLKKKYTEVKIWKYSKKTHIQRKRFIDTINRVEYWDYLCFRDFDSNKCITNKKDKIIAKFNRIDRKKIFIVREEIESWYLAGVDNNFLRSIGANNLMDCPSIYITKEKFNRIIPKNMPRVLFLRKILQNFNLDLALKNNNSLKYLFKKLFS
ncbi:MAG: hypothetical protein ACTSQJ_15285 [Promethearchaeota archaeon]